MRAATYSRVSTRGQTTDSQRERLREYCERQGWEVVEYVDEGVSGAKAKRPALDSMLEAVHRREVDAVVCTRLDRVGRSTRHLLEIAEKLQAANVRLVVLDQAVDSATSVGRLVFSVLASIAEFERELIKERVAAGLDRARRRGVRLGRKPVLDREGRARARRLAAAGHPVRRVAELLGVSVGAAHAAMRASS